MTKVEFGFANLSALLFESTQVAQYIFPSINRSHGYVFFQLGWKFLERWSHFLFSSYCMTWSSCEHCKSALGSSAVARRFLEGNKKAWNLFHSWSNLTRKKSPRWRTGGSHPGPSGVSWKQDPTPGGGGGGTDGMVVVSLRGVNFGFWSRLGCSGQSANILSRQGLV